MATVATRPATMTSVSSATWCAIPTKDNLAAAAIRLSKNHAESYYRTPTPTPAAAPHQNQSAQKSDVLKNHSNQWFQVGGHENNLRPSGNSVYKLVSGADNMEIAVYDALKKDEQLRDLVPCFYSTYTDGCRNYLVIENLLSKFNNPHVMVLKMGTRTYLESDEIETEREDLYRKMVKQDPHEPTEAEHKVGKVTKKRYMEFRERKSTSAELGFRIEGIRYPDKDPQTDFKTLGPLEKVVATVANFLKSRPEVRECFLNRLSHIRDRLEQSEYFKRHEMVGTSLYLIYDEKDFGAWLIDFGKTRRVPDGVVLDHRTAWKPGTHEEGFLTGLDNIINIFKGDKLDSALNARNER